MNQVKPSSSQQVVKFQRLIFGLSLLVAFVFSWLPLVILVAVLMLFSSFLPTRFLPLYRIFLVFNPETEDVCLCNRGGTFACGVGGLILVLAVFFDIINQQAIAWSLIVVVAAMLLIAATTGFCLGSLVYEWVKRKL